LDQEILEAAMHVLAEQIKEHFDAHEIEVAGSQTLEGATYDEYVGLTCKGGDQASKNGQDKSKGQRPLATDEFR
jgi:hypothetical protein